MSIGDDAFWGGSGDELWNGLHILVRDVYLEIDVFTPDDLLALREAQTLADILLGELYPVR